MATLTIGSQLNNSLQEILTFSDIVPGDEPSYQMCKTIYLYHPLGKKMADAPIAMAMSQPREITIQKGPEEKIREAFELEWKAINADKYIFNTCRLSRIYGVSAIALLVDKQKTDSPLTDYTGLYGADISFNVFDPLNIAGSVVLNQVPNDIDFLKTKSIVVQGQAYHPSRTRIVMNEDPIYLGYTIASFGYVGRSCYQRGLFPLKSFISSLVTDDMVVRKAGVIIAKIKQAGSIADNAILRFLGIKRQIVQAAESNNVVSISPEEAIESINLSNLDAPYLSARKNILENIAVSDDMPAKLLNSETFAEGFGEGSEDAKMVARYIDRKRAEMQPLYDFFDKIVQYRAWNPEFYKTIQNQYPNEYGSKSYQVAFNEWQNDFSVQWPSLLTEPDSEKAKAEDVKLKALIAVAEILLPVADPENKAKIVEFVADNFNALKWMFDSPLILDYEALAEYEPPTPEAGLQEPKPEAPFSSKDGVPRHETQSRRKSAKDSKVPAKNGKIKDHVLS